MEQFGTERSRRTREAWRLLARVERGKRTALVGVVAVIVGIGEGFKLGGRWGIAVAALGVVAGVAMVVTGRRAMHAARTELEERRRRWNEAPESEAEPDARPR